MNSIEKEIFSQINIQLKDINDRLIELEKAVNKGKGALGLIMLIVSVAGLILGYIKLGR